LNRYRTEDVPKQLKQWLEALRSAAQNELDQGHRIDL
jgi:hypothetical protein